MCAHGIDPRYEKIAAIAQRQRIPRLLRRIVDIRQLMSAAALNGLCAPRCRRSALSPPSCGSSTVRRRANRALVDVAIHAAINPKRLTCRSPRIGPRGSDSAAVAARAASDVCASSVTTSIASDATWYDTASQSVRPARMSSAANAITVTRMTTAIRLTQLFPKDRTTLSGASGRNLVEVIERRRRAFGAPVSDGYRRKTFDILHCKESRQ